MFKARQSVFTVEETDAKHATQGSRMAMVYGFSLLTLLAAIFASHIILGKVITTQRTFTSVNTLIRDTQVSMTDSIGVLSDYREETKKKRTNTRLIELITRRAKSSVDELTALQAKLANMTEELQATPAWDDTKWILEDKANSLNDKLSDYIRQMKITITRSANGGNTALTQIPVEAAGARYGAMFAGYRKASDLLEEKLNQNSNKIEYVHRALTALVVIVILLISFLVVMPLWKRVIKEHNRLKKAHKKLHKIAYTDKDTGLPNLDGMESQLNNLVSFSDNSSSFYLLLVRLRNLDEIYNLIGSHKVDELLQSVSLRLKTWDNRTLQWCRSGEAEFSTLITEKRYNAADKWTSALHRVLTSNLTVEGVIVRPEVSLAVSRIEKSVAFQTNVLWEHQSNARLASVNFRPLSCWLPEYKPGMKNKLAAQNDLINRIGEGIAAGEFVPFYQVKVSAESGEPCALEVLARWITADGTVISPGEFIPAAESSGLIIKLTYSLFEQVLADVKQWCASGLTVGRVAINVAADVLHHRELLPRLNEFNTALPALCEGLDVEITENIALGDNIEQIETILHRIRGMGIHVAIDDFGTGYASMQTLIDMPVDVLKIDRSFVLPMTENGEGNEVVSAVISLSNNLKKRCVVEGVETEWQWTQLAALGADELQGFFFHKPTNQADTTEMLLQSINWKMTG